jgi:hypothetical protein
MTRYILRVEFFDGAPLPDDEVSFASLDAATTEAKAVMVELITIAIREKLRVPKRIAIADEAGREVGSFLAADFVPEPLRQLK